MKKIYRLLYSNKFVAMVMLLMQIITFVAMYIWISDYSKVLFGLSTVLSAVLIIFEINRTEESTFKMTWITLIAIIPIFGALFYLFTRAQGVSMNIGDDYKNIQEANKKFFIINHTSRMWNEILEILKKKVKQGVEVRVMYDGMGCIVTLPRKYNEYLERQGIKCRIFSPIVPLLSTHQNNRDHRKIIVIDGAVAFCGGINISDEYINEKMRFGHWKDTGFMLRGEAVAGFTAMFLEMWNVNDEHIEDCGEYIQASKKYSVSTDGFVIPFGDTPLDEVYVGKRAYINNLNNASEYTYIMTPYLVIDDEMYECMKYAAQRGVDVKIIMPHIPDKKYAFYLARTYYKELLKAGIEIYEYTPGFVHAKMSISDGKKAIVGTVNHDYRSLYLHYECAAYMLNVPAVMDIERDFKDTLELSQKITLEDVKHFNIFTKLLGHIIRLVAPLL